MQLTFGGTEGFSQRKKFRREIIQGEMEQVVLWNRLLAMIKPVSGHPGHCSSGRLALCSQVLLAHSG